MWKTVALVLGISLASMLAAIGLLWWVANWHRIRSGAILTWRRLWN